MPNSEVCRQSVLDEDHFKTLYKIMNMNTCYICLRRKFDQAYLFQILDIRSI